MPIAFNTEHQQQLLTWGSAFLLGISIGRWIGSWRENKEKDKLRNIVSESSVLIAAWRAVESLELDGKLFSDELAAPLAGHKVFKKALSQAKPIDPTAEGPPGKRLYKISYVAQRTWWFDRQIMSALTSPAVPAAKGWLSARLRGSFSSRGPSAPPRQVVNLGSGMDTRPWRLPLPPGTSWFEIDGSDVLQAKIRALKSAGAELPDEGMVGTAHPIRCARWATVAADVSDTENLMELLRIKGFDISQPTVWIAEGLLMYLSQAQAEDLLSHIASQSAPGSTFIGHALTDELLQQLQAPGGCDNRRVVFPSALLQECKSSAPYEVRPWLDSLGWTLMSQSTKGATAQLICHGQTHGKCDFDTDEGVDSDREVVYFVGRNAEKHGFF